MEFGSGRWVGGAVGSVEGEPPLIVCDLPYVFVEEPVVPSAEKDQIVQVGGSALAPVEDVVGVDPGGPSAAGEPASPVAGLEQPSQPPGDRHGPPSHPDDPVVPLDGAFDDRITGQPSGGVVGYQGAQPGFGDT